MIRSIIKTILPYGIVSTIKARNLLRIEGQKRKAFEDKIKKILSDGKPINLELGSGGKRGDGIWTTMDLDRNSDIPFNLLDRLPFPDSSVSRIYSSHFLEHFYTKDIIRILSECYRVLKSGGWISACVPDGSIYVKAYANGQKLDPHIWLRYEPAATILSDIDTVNYMAYMDDEHKHLFDIDNLCAFFKNAGFRDVKPRTLIKGLDLDVRDYQSIYVEATK